MLQRTGKYCACPFDMRHHAAWPNAVQDRSSTPQQITGPCSAHSALLLTLAFAFLSFPDLRNFVVFTLTDSAVSQNAHAVIWPEATVAP